MLNDNQKHVMRGQTVYTEAQVQRKVDRALENERLKNKGAYRTKREMYVMVLEELGITELNSPNTPSSRWLVNGEEDPHPKLINEERGSLMLGNFTDEELANAIYMHGNPCDAEKTRRLLKGDIADIAYLTAGKERIRWLSRHLEAQLKANSKLADMIKYLLKEIDDFGFELPPAFVPADGDGSEHAESYRNGANYMLNEVKGKLGFPYKHDGDNAIIPIVQALKDKAAMVSNEVV